MGSTMMRNEDLAKIRDQALLIHRGWKQRSFTSDLIIQQKWSTVWPDSTISQEAPYVENIYIEALEDKAATAASLNPTIYVPPKLATAHDRGEREAQKKRKVFATYASESRLPVHKIVWFMDWWKDSAMYSMPWCDWFDPSPRQPYFIRQDPRQVYPMSHDSRGNLTSALVSRIRRIGDLENELGKDAPALRAMKAARQQRQWNETETIEELWWFDRDEWAWALFDTGYDPHFGTYRYVAPGSYQGNGNFGESSVFWLLEPQRHKLSRCPIVEGKRGRSDSEYWGALDVMLPQMRHAHELMAMIMKDVSGNIYGPTLIENVQNFEEYGPQAVMIGDGSGKARIEQIRAPINYEGHQVVQGQLDAARNAGKYPQQRGGDPGASIVSAKGTNALQGSFNSEQAAAQTDFENFLENTLSVTAEFDEKWCGGSKRITGFDQGQAFTERYDPRTMFNTMAGHEAGEKGDYRVLVSYGGGLGLDQAQYLVQIATAMELKGMSRREFMQKSGLVDDAIATENEMMLEAIVDSFKALMLQQATEAGNMDPLLRLAEKADKQSESMREAVLEVIRETFAAPPAGAGGGAGGESPIDVLKQARSLGAGGIPGNAEGQPSMPGVGPSLRGVLPASAQRALAQTAPGGTAT